MSHLRSGLAAIVLLGGFVGTASAQGFGYSNGFGGVYQGYGLNTGTYGTTNGFGGFGARGGYYNSYYGRSFPPVVPQTYNNLGGLMNSIQTQTGRPNSYSYGSNYGVRRRRVR